MYIPYHNYLSIIQFVDLYYTLLDFNYVFFVSCGTKSDFKVGKFVYDFRHRSGLEILLKL